MTACRLRPVSSTVHDSYMRKPSVRDVVLVGLVAAQVLQRYDIKQLTVLSLLHRDELRFTGSVLHHYGNILGLVQPSEERRLRAVRSDDA